MRSERGRVTAGSQRAALAPSHVHAPVTCTHVPCTQVNTHHLCPLTHTLPPPPCDPNPQPPTPNPLLPLPPTHLVCGHHAAQRCGQSCDDGSRGAVAGVREQVVALVHVAAVDAAAAVLVQDRLRRGICKDWYREV